MKTRVLAGLVIFIICIVFTIITANASSALSDYGFHKINKVIGSTDGPLNNYQVMLIVHRDNGTDSGEDVYLNGHSLSWPNDIRFADANGGLYSYWIQSYDDDSATVWVKISRIPAAPGSTSIEMYYGKAGDISASNGDDTFILFDDFNENTLDTGKWVKVMGDVSADAFVSDGMLELKSGTITDVSRPFVRSAKVYSGEYTIDVDAKYTGLNSIIIATDWDGTLSGQYMGPNNGYQCYYNSWADNYQYWEIARVTSGKEVNLGQYDYDQDNGFHAISMTQKPQITLAVDGATLLSGATDTKYKSGYVGLGGREDQRYVQTYYDNFRMRSYTPDPPSFGRWADVDTGGSIIGDNLVLILLILLTMLVILVLGVVAIFIAWTVFRS